MNPKEVIFLKKRLGGNPQIKIMKEGIKKGLEGTHYDDRILPVQSTKYKLKDESGQLLNGGMLNKMIMYTTAMMEVKSAMEVFVAAPTAGSCGVLPGTLFGAAEALDSDPDTIIKALFSAGIIGVFIAEYATFSAEVAGCQAETGAGGSIGAELCRQIVRRQFKTRSDCCFVRASKFTRHHL